MWFRRSLNPRVSCVFLLIIFNSLPGIVLSAVVTLDSIRIYKTHEWWKKPTVYFHCNGENRTVLPDVKNTDVDYAFKGEESWQPLTELSDGKCKRCGFYEKDTIKSDDVYDEWELCPSDFRDGKYTREKEGEFTATFLCEDCHSKKSKSATITTSSKHDRQKGIHVAIIVLIVFAASSVVIIIGVAVFKFWQKKKRQQDQARFLKLFEDGDDIEDELGLAHVI